MNVGTEKMSAKDFVAMQTAGSGKGSKRKLVANEPSEAHIQATLVQALRQCGYDVLETGQDRSQLQGRIVRAIYSYLRTGIGEAFIFNLVGKVLRSWSNNDAGLPDVFVSHPDWPVGEWLGLELKTPTGRVRPEQQALADAGRVVIVRGVYEGLCSVCDKETKFSEIGTIEQWNASLARGLKVYSIAEQFQEVK